MDKDRILLHEHSSYKSLFFRKSRYMKWGESALFLIGVYLLSQFLSWSTLEFKVIALLLAAGVIGLSPFLYRVILRPEYSLSPGFLTISIKGKTERIPLTKVQASGDLRFMYYINDKKTNLMVSDQFLQYLDAELEKFKQRR